MTFAQKLDKKRDKILFKHYQYRGGAEYIDIITAMDEYAAYRLRIIEQAITANFCIALLKLPSSIMVEYKIDADELATKIKSFITNH